MKYIICILYHFNTDMVHAAKSFVYDQQYGGRWLGDTGSQAINIHCIALVTL